MMPDFVDALSGRLGAAFKNALNPVAIHRPRENGVGSNIVLAKLHRKRLHESDQLLRSVTG